MQRKYIVLILIVLTLAAFLFTYVQGGKELDIADVSGKKILLVPLDGRPPCKDFVVNLSKMADYEILVPPGKAQDYYTLAGDTELMTEWLFENAPKATGAIISVDQLFYGGLLAGREKILSEEEMDKFIAKLRELHEKNPRLPLYAFYILPRMAPQNSVEDHKERKMLTEYSRLIGKKYAGEFADEERIEYLEEHISEENMKHYWDKQESSSLLAKKLSILAKEGVLTRLILGQDDGEPYSIPNLEKENIRIFLKENEITEDKVFITHGADEIALTLLAEIKNREVGIKPKVYLAYNDETTKERVMPFMAVSLSEVAVEKIEMLNGNVADTPEDADFVLYISAVSKDTMSVRQRSVDDIVVLSKNNEVALVDLSQHYRFIELLLPILIKENFPIHNLLAYAGWNTASNSIGTALATGTVYIASKKLAKDDENILRIEKNRLALLDNRILEDAYYLKDVIDLINISLIKEGYKNTADMDLQKNARYADEALKSAMEKRINHYKNTASFKAPLSIRFKNGEEKFLRVKDIQAQMDFPWPRTFEIRLKSTHTLLLE